MFGRLLRVWPLGHESRLTGRRQSVGLAGAQAVSNMQDGSICVPINIGEAR